MVSDIFFYDKFICSIISIYEDALGIVTARVLQSLCQISLILANQITLIAYLQSELLRYHVATYEYTNHNK